MDEKVVRLSEVARSIGISYETARRWAVAGVLPVFKFHESGHWVAYRSAVDEFVAKRKNQPPAG